MGESLDQDFYKMFFTLLNISDELEMAMYTFSLLDPECEIIIYSKV